MKFIKIKGAKEQNLKSLNVDIPKEQVTVITGVSGSGKSSLAFATLFEEGKRRYLESLSSYARMFLGGSEKPNVDSIEGLCPTIAIDQKTTSHNPRSTIGTVTEIYDYLRILFASIGIPFCPHGHGKITSLSNKAIIQKVLEATQNNDKIIILIPLIKRQKGSFIDLFEQLKREGYIRVKCDDNEYKLDEDIKLDKNVFHDIKIILDRIIFNNDEETKTRLTNSIYQALEKGKGNVEVMINNTTYNYSSAHTCKECGFSIPTIDHRLFSFNNSLGACPCCHGLGFNFDVDINKLIPDRSLSINQGAIVYFKNTIGSDSIDWMKFDALLKHYKIDKNTPIEKLSKQELNIILEGSDEPIHHSFTSSGGTKYEKNMPIIGVATLIKNRHTQTTSELAQEFYSRYLSQVTCEKCNGKRLNEMALSIKINNINIMDFCEMSIFDSLNFLLNLKLSKNEEVIAKQVIDEIITRLSFLSDVGLSYLTLSRAAMTLSGGEAQRIRLASQISSKLSGVLYILDEPSIGLHQKDNNLLISSFKSIRDNGNTVVVVEHDLETIESADNVVEIGPGAGGNGGELVYSGSVSGLKKADTITGKYLSKKLEIETPKTRRSGNGSNIILKGATLNNINDVEITIPIGKMIAVTGVSGSGKSTLINDILVPNLIKKISNPFIDAPKIKSLVGYNNIKKIISVSQDPIGQTPKSNPATYVGVFDDIRDLFASLPESKAIGLSKTHFSFNTKPGRCQKCEGDGYIRKDMQFMPAVYVECDECHGKRFDDQVLSIRYNHKNIYDVLDMSINEGMNFFKSYPHIFRKLQLLNDVGLGYLKIGLSSDKLSGGEAQRVKLAKFLQKDADNKTIIVLDEPTTGLHIDDVKKLIEILYRILKQGTTIIVIEHNLDLIKCADHIIDMGPDGGIYGGKIIATGTPEQVATKDSISYTAKFLKRILK